MNRKNISFLLCSLALSFGAIGVHPFLANQKVSSVSASSKASYGNIGKLSYYANGYTSYSFYSLGENTLSGLSASWENAYTANVSYSAFDEPQLVQLKYVEGPRGKLSFYTEFLGYGHHEVTPLEGDTVTLSGAFTCSATDTSFTVSETIFTYRSGSWAKSYSDDELEVYDKTTLRDYGLGESRAFTNPFFTDGMGKVNYLAPISKNNTTNSFSFSVEADFAEKTSSDDYDKIELRFRGSAAWTGYHFVFCPSWGTSGVVIVETDSIGNKTPDTAIDLSSGKHLIEAGVIDIKNSDNVWVYAKVDSKIAISETLPKTSEYSSSRFGFGVTNIPSATPFVISSTGTSYVNDSGLVLHPEYSMANAGKGIYFTESDNDLPYSSAWDARSYALETDSASINGVGIMNLDNPIGSLIKFDKNSYYLALSDLGKNATDGDLVVMDGYFVYISSTGEKLVHRVAETGFYYSNGAYTAIKDTRAYLVSLLNNAIDVNDYSDSDAAQINSIISNAATNINAAKKFVDAYKIYSNTLLSFDEFEVSTEKLDQMKTAAISEIRNYVDLTAYFDTDQETILEIIEETVTAISSANTNKQIKDILENAKARIDAVKTIGDYYEEKILSLEEGFEQYLDVYDVASLADVGWGEEVSIYDADTVKGNISNDGSSLTAENSFAPSEDNENGNVIFQFAYQSTTTNAGRYGGQIFIRLRGIQYFSYRFDIGIENGGVRAIRMESDAKNNVVGAAYDVLSADQEHVIKLAAVDVKYSNRTWMSINVDGNYVVNAIVDSISWATNPRVSTSDNFTTEGAICTVKDIREGTTCSSNVSFEGRGNLDESHSNPERGIYIAMEENNLPYNEWDNAAFPLSKDCITVNGESKAKIGTKAIIKYGETSYYIALFDQGIEINAGDEVRVKGTFTFFDTIDNTKIVIRILEMIFTFDGSDWTQETTLEQVKEDAIIELRNYADPSAYDETNQKALATAVEEGISNINAATTKEGVKEALKNAKDVIDAIPTILDSYKVTAKATINNYKNDNMSEYRDLQQEEILTIKEEACEKIDAATSFKQVDTIVKEAKDAIDEIKTSAELDALELAEHKASAKKEIESIYNALDLEKYSDENIEVINGLVVSAKAAIDAASTIDEIELAVNNFKAELAKVPTVKTNSSGCGGSIIATSGLLAILSLAGLSVISLRKKEY